MSRAGDIVRGPYFLSMKNEVEVLYNGECPICSREVRHYEKLSKQAALPIQYDDIVDADALERWGVTPDQAAKRFHVRKEGKIYSGIPAFVVLWRDIPQFVWLSKLVNLPVVHWTAVKVYDYILAPVLYAAHVRRVARRETTDQTT
ncbi:MAG: DUF393 domain-containing protein [Pseudomonadota bacterium]